MSQISRTTDIKNKIRSSASTLTSSSCLVSKKMSPMRLVSLVACTLCVIACLMPVKPADAGRLQDFIQNLVGGGSNSNNSNKANSNSNTDSSSSNNNNNNNNESNDADTAASSDSSNDQPMTPMMSAMNPFMRYPSFYDSFGPASFGSGFPGMSFSNPMSAMSAMSPMAAMAGSGSNLGGAFSPASFGPATFGSFGSSSSSPMSAFGGAANGMSASTLNNVYASSPSLMGGYTPYYGRRR